MSKNNININKAIKAVWKNLPNLIEVDEKDETAAKNLIISILIALNIQIFQENN